LITIAKKKPNRIHAQLNRLLLRNERILQPALVKWFGFALKQIRRDLARKFSKDRAADITAKMTYWEEIEGNGVRAVKPAVLKIMGNGAQKAYTIAEFAETFDVLNVRSVELADKICSRMVTNVTEKTKEGISTYIREGIREGKSMPKIAKELRPFVGLTKSQTESVLNYRKLLGDKDKFPKLTAAEIDHKVQRYADKTHRQRMQTIARTETARAQSEGYLLGLEDAGVEKVEFSATASACEELCQPLNGNEYTIEESRGMIPVHPRCTCSWLPVV